jgi:predicted ribosome quality control (RQC) complex YloA/Tae2 family protein
LTFDALVLAAAVAELKQALLNARVQRIYQPSATEIVLHLHRYREQHCLLLSCHPRLARLHLTGASFSNPQSPPPFCMLLRKYLVGSSLAAITVPPLERVAVFQFNPPEGRPGARLIAEVMGRRSNIILVDEGGTILGAIKTVSRESNPHRAVLPGELYQPPPVPPRLDPLAFTPRQLQEALAPRLEKGSSPEAALSAAVQGLSPLMARELLHRSGGLLPGRQDLERLAGEIKALFLASREGRWEPVLVPEGGLYAAFPLKHLDLKQPAYREINRLLDDFYRELARRELLARKQETVNRLVRQHLSRLETKLARQQEELERAEDADAYKLKGELLLAYPHAVPRGATRVELPDPEGSGQKLAIELNPALGAVDNARAYFSRYRKAKKGLEKIRTQMEKTREEKKYWEEIRFAAGEGDAASLEEICQELEEAGYLKGKKGEGGSRKKGAPPPQPLSYRTSLGHTVLVGRNNRQNDYITFKLASRRDTWLHAKDRPGGHVLLKDAPYPPPAESLEEAALLAAYHSRGREESAVPVDFTSVRHVRRGPGGKPGFVLYDHFQTITVNMKDPRLKKILARAGQPEAEAPPAD